MNLSDRGNLNKHFNALHEEKCTIFKWCVSQNFVLLYSGQNFVTNGVRNWAKDSLSSV